MRVRIAYIYALLVATIISVQYIAIIYSVLSLSSYRIKDKVDKQIFETDWPIKLAWNRVTLLWMGNNHLTPGRLISGKVLRGT